VVWEAGRWEGRSPDAQQVVGPRQSMLVCAGWHVVVFGLSQMHGMMAYDTSIGAGELHGRSTSGKGDDDVREESIQWHRHDECVSVVCTTTVPRRDVQVWCAGMVVVCPYITNGVEVVCYNLRCTCDAPEYAASICGNPGLVGLRTDLLDRIARA
jgi:hypothetical protein